MGQNLNKTYMGNFVWDYMMIMENPGHDHFINVHVVLLGTGQFRRFARFDTICTI